MGIAAYNRGSAAISRMIDQERGPAEFVLMQDLNSIPKLPDAPRPFGPIHFVPGHGGWWATCPVTGFGYWHRTLRQAVASLRITIVEFRLVKDEPTWIGNPE